MRPSCNPHQRRATVRNSGNFRSDMLTRLCDIIMSAGRVVCRIMVLDTRCDVAHKAAVTVGGRPELLSRLRSSFHALPRQTASGSIQMSMTARESFHNERYHFMTSSP
jgi:hypothetical protein